jgi:hypothetical protein
MIEREHAGELVLDGSANFFGTESDGPLQIRGNGSLAVYQDGIRFERWIPPRTIWIPRKAVHAIDSTRSHCDKTQFVRLLRIRYENERGEADSVAWRVADVDRWLDALREWGRGNPNVTIDT